MIVNVLAFYERMSRYMTPHWYTVLQYIRNLIGPSPQDYYILTDGQVLPATTYLPESVRSTAHLYCFNTQRIVLATNPSPEGRFRHLSYLTATLTGENVDVVDISDWLDDVSVNPEPAIHIRQLFHLWSLVHNRYIPLSGAETVIVVTTNDGETATITNL